MGAWQHHKPAPVIESFISNQEGKNIMKKFRNLSTVLAILVILGCNFINAYFEPESGSTAEIPPIGTSQAPKSSPVITEPIEGQSTMAAVATDPGALLQPSDLKYLGAFRLPDGPPEIGWDYSGAAMAYYPLGDPNGASDGFPGSIFATGHNWNQFISEISIPAPIVSPAKDLNALNTASTLQEFQDIRADLHTHLELEIPRAGLAILPPQDGQNSDKLYFCWHQHMGECDTYPTHGWSDLDLSDPQSTGPWRIAEHWNYTICDYMFAIPQTWADANTPGMRLATGRFRDGGQGGMGPSLLAIGPWMHGNPPQRGSTIDASTLLLYSDVYTEANHSLNNYHHSDEWSGGAWLTAGEKSALLFVGTKGRGECWYGCQDGTVWPDEPPFPPECPERGWWSTSFEGVILFYNPQELAAVARGEMETWAPQPYATLNIDPHLFSINSPQQWSHVGAAGYDRDRGYLYIFEPLADGDKSLIHVWRVVP